MAGIIEVGNCHSGIEGVYVGRPSALGNPFVIGRDGGRSEVIWRYAEYLEAQSAEAGPVREALIDLYRRHHRGEHLVLLCHCHPKPCHADIIRDFLLRQPAPKPHEDNRLEPS